MKERHNGQQAITLFESQPFANLSGVSDHIAMREQTSFWLSGGTGCVDDDRLIIHFDGRCRNFIRLITEILCRLSLVVKTNHGLQGRQLTSNTLDDWQEL